jgi:cytochrome c peroxidase
MKDRKTSHLKNNASGWIRFSLAAKSWSALGLVSFVAYGVLIGCSHVSLPPQPDADISPQQLFMFSPLEAALPASGQAALRVGLGRRLYYDAHLSENGSISCNSCHQLNKYGVDPGKPVSFGHSNQPGNRNSPTVYNAGLQFAQFWDGRAATLAAQASGPMMNPVEMGMSGPDAVLAYVRSRPDYVRQFHVAYPAVKDPITLDNLTDAIAVFEAGLLTPARWDQYLEGDTAALTEPEKQGLRVFLRSGCASCHAGVDMGGNSYEQLGAVKNGPDRSDIGRAGMTHLASDSLYFKVPTLRNVEMTGPWFHNGQVRTLDEAVRLMAKYEAGEHLSDADVHSIVVFLHSLTGEIPQQYIQQPSTNAAAKNGSVGPAKIRSTLISTTQEGQ